VIFEASAVNLVEDPFQRPFDNSEKGSSWGLTGRRNGARSARVAAVHYSKPHHGLRVGELWALLADELRRDGEGVLGRYPLCAMRS
jgi:hypothetical protein